MSRQFYLFEQGNIEVLKSLNYEVHCAANYDDANERLDSLDIIRHNFDIKRSPVSFKNIIAYKQLKKIIKTENFDAIHCHSPMGGVLTRLIAKSCGVDTVLYTAHGFHFYKGAPLINWLIYYPIEKWLSKYTDLIITINKEDFHRAKLFNTCRVEYVPGIGIECDKIKKTQNQRRFKRLEFTLTDNTFLILSIGELNKNKNHESIIRAIANLNNRNIQYFICGSGVLEKKLRLLINSLELNDNVKLLGYRNDIHELCAAADLFVFPSYREGLSVSLMEAMAAGLPIIASNIRGNTDLIKSNINGILVEPDDIESIKTSILKLMNEPKLRNKMKLNNENDIEKFAIQNVSELMKNIYNSL